MLARGPAGASVPAPPVYLLGVLAALKAAGLVLVAEAIARGVASLAGGLLPGPDLLWLGAAGAVLRACAAWAQQGAAQRLAHGVKERLRREALERILADGGPGDGRQGTGALSVLLTRGLDGLDKYHTQYLPALITCAVVPPLVGARILAADWVSALVIVLTIPLIPVFMVLIGWHTQDRTAEARASLDRLSDHLLELAKGLPALVGLGRASAQTRALSDIGAGYSRRTMETLRIAFLSSLALELISTISVAVVAVFVGVRLVHGEVGLEVGLLALILAPECYLPLRDVGAAHHASDDGLEVGRNVRSIIDAPSGPTTGSRAAEGEPAGTQRLTLRFDGSGAPVVRDLSLILVPGTITALRGPSGSGKSTLMGVLAGIPQPGLRVDGAVSPVRGPLAWVPQHPEPFTDTVREELAFYAGTPLADGRLSEALAAVGGRHLLDKTTGELSPGELRRLALARALLRLGPDGGTLFLDEPTAHVDEATSGILRRTVAGLRGSVTVVLIAHDSETADLADQTVDLGAPVAAVSANRSQPLASGKAGAPPGTTPVPAVRSEPDLPQSANVGQARTAWRALALVRPWSPRFLAALAFGTGSAACAVALTALSGWLIVRASEQPPILYLLAAIVGVRFFGIGRSLLRYCERLWLHEAILATADGIRLRLWRTLLGRAHSWRSLSRGSGGIELLVGDIDELRDTAARAVFPPLTSILTGLGAIATTALLLPDALAWQVVAVAVGLLGAPAAALLAERSAGAAGIRLRARSLAATAGLLRASRDISVNGLADRALDSLAALEIRAARSVRRSSWAAGIGQGLVILGCTAAAVAILAGSGGQPAEIVAVVVLMQLALIEPFTAGVAAVQQWAPLGALTRRLDAQLEPAGAAGHAGHRAPAAETVTGADAPALALVDAAVGYEPGVDVVEGVTLDVRRGSWTALTGPSGSGKSTIIGALLGFLPLSRGRYLVGIPAGRIGDALPAAWCPQEGHLFDSSVRANLLLARGPEEPVGDDELWRVLDAVGLAGTVRGRADGLDTRIGAGGGRLSGGERQRLAVARALLTRSQALILDEPTAHLDYDGAARLMRDLRSGLGDRPVLLVTHDRAEALSCDTGVDLVPANAGDHLRWDHAYA